MTTKHDDTGSVWDAIRAQHQELLAERDPLYLDDPQHPGVVLKYRHFTLKETERSAKGLAKIRQITDQALIGAIDTLLIGTAEILRQSPDGEVPKGRHGDELYPRPLKSFGDAGDPPMRYDERLAQVMGFTGTKARQILREWWANDMWKILDHAAEVSAWLSGEAPEIRDDFEADLQGN